MGSSPTPPPAHHEAEDVKERHAALYHDLRAPLSAIQALTHALEDDVFEPHERQEHVERLRVLAERLLDLTADLQAEPHQWQPAPVALGDLARSAVAVGAAAALAVDVAVTLVVDDTGVVVHVAAARVARALDNIIANAIRHTPRGGRVTVTALAEPGWGTIVVADGCGGIPTVEIDLVFNPGFQGELQAGREGLGLWSAQRLVREQAGQIDVANDGPGCRFEVRLPLSTSTRAGEL